MNLYRRVIALSCLALLLPGCASNSEYSPLIGAEPEIDATLTRAPRTLRLYYNALPDVSRSSLRLVGPSGEHQLRGLHTMASDDLMIEIMDPVTEGDYRVEWTTVVGNDPVVYSGVYQFTVVSD